MERDGPVPEPSPSGDFSGYYYRPGEVALGGDADKLQALSDGYFGLNWVFLANVVLAIGLRTANILAVERLETALALVLGGLSVLFITVALLSYPCNLKIVRGKGWAPGTAVLASFLMALNSVLCCGIIGYIVMQQIASTEMRKYGLAGSFFGIRKRDVEARIAQLRAAPGPPGFQA